ncbi:SPOR domain-containing protein [Octadecabacter sp. 1_MG-2023]|uniref:SPOR domain-containing protein n=1 Tax=unclassified Octadecabacter TaxID=196158 RepID=UPI001C08CCFE|nr:MULTISPECIES: SPOR domain-containing protein [unclassified Octadecabacter]MBU2993859.1 SPOR domain-containing protein [Octadecabacter sp. B2R22]MDO6735295.1 SPOR domain-containing protein [Octadecabacter sp. 1_MG-2023]
MSGKTRVTFKKFAIPLAASSIIALSGCDENGEFAFPTLDNAAANDTIAASDGAAQSVQLVERDVEAPDAFQVTESGLWDGRPSLGGVWVAHPDVTEPERVIIRNQSNGTFVIGALFRRERDNPGPSLQVSSDAASALQMLAGAPAQLQVTALRREEVADAPEATPTADFEAPVDIAAAPIDSAPLDVPDPIAAAAAAIDAADVATPAPAPSPAPTPASSSLSKPFIQIGIFSVEANADGTAARMRSNGIVPTVLEQTSQGRTFWRVIVGPATSESERAELLRQVKAQGFEDAYFVTN